MNKPPPDWRTIRLFAIILPIGFIFMLVAGQIAIRLPSSWSLSADMRSRITPNFLLRRPDRTVAPLVAEAGTVVDQSYLTPGTGTAIVSSIGVVQPNGSATFTPRPPATATATVRVAPSATRTNAPTATFTRRPATVPVSTSTRTPTRTPIRTSTSGTSTATVTRTATGVFTATRTATRTTTPTATRTATFIPTPTATFTATRTPSATTTFTSIPTATFTATPTATLTATATSTNTFTPTPTFTATATSTPIFSGTPTAVPPDLVVGPPDGTPGFLPDESYVIINLTTPIVVNNLQDGNYDFAVYEFLVAPSNDRIQLDNIIISISTDNNNYFEVFNWWDNAPNSNTSISQHPISPSLEIDNYLIYIADLYGMTIRSGILIDVEDAPSNPPAGDYYFIAIEVPTTGGDGSGIDAIEILEVPIPFP